MTFAHTVTRLIDGFRDLGRFGGATAVGPALSFIGIAVVARTAERDELVLFNLCIITATLTAQLGAGFDGAASRLLSREAINYRESLIWPVVWRSITILASVPLIAAIIFLGPSGSKDYPILFCAITLGGVASGSMMVAMIQGQAYGRVGQLIHRQLIYYVPFLLGIVTGTWIGSLQAILVGWIIASIVSLALTSLIMHSSYDSFSSGPIGPFGSPEYRKLAFAVLAAGAAHSLAERLDAFAASVYFSSGAAADFVVAQRFSLFLLLAAGAVHTLTISRMSGISAPRDAALAYARLWPSYVLMTVGAVLVAFAGSTFDTVLFGAAFELGFWQILVLTAPYAIFAIYSPYALSLAALGERATLQRTTVVAVITKFMVVAIAVARHSLTALYLSTLISATAGLVVAYMCYRRANHRGPAAV